MTMSTKNVLLSHAHSFHISHGCFCRVKLKLYGSVSLKYYQVAFYQRKFNLPSKIKPTLLSRDNTELPSIPLGLKWPLLAALSYSHSALRFKSAISSSRKPSVRTLPHSGLHYFCSSHNTLYNPIIVLVSLHYPFP